MPIPIVEINPNSKLPPSIIHSINACGRANRIPDITYGFHPLLISSKAENTAPRYTISSEKAINRK